MTLDGVTRTLPAPFFVLATQNPLHQVGTFPLPESQLDRFMMRLEIGYPGPDAERALLTGEDRRSVVAELEPAMNADTLLALQDEASRVRVSEALLDYLQALLAWSRESGEFVLGLSPRAGLSLLRASQGWAILSGRSYVVPEDLQAVLPGVVGHRLTAAGSGAGMDTGELVEILMRAVPIP